VAQSKHPTDIVAFPLSKNQLVVLQKEGQALKVDPQSGKSEQLFAVGVRTSSEQGLLGLAFSPEFTSNKLFYLHYNPQGGKRRTRIAEWKWDKPATEKRMLVEVDQPFVNHNGAKFALIRMASSILAWATGAVVVIPKVTGKTGKLSWDLSCALMLQSKGQ